MAGTVTSTKTTQQPDYIEDPVKRILANAEALVEQTPFPVYGEERLAKAQSPSVAGLGTIKSLGDSSRLYGGGVLSGLRDANLRFGGGYAEGIAKNGIGAFDRADTAQMRRGQIQDVSGYGSNQVDRSYYMNPYMQQVGDVAERDMVRANEQQRMRDTDRAAGSGAYGGSRHGIVDAERNRNLERNLGDMRSKILGEGYDRASSLITQDLDRRLRGDTLNQAADTTTATQNLGQQGQTNLANAELGLQHQTADAQASLSGAQQMMNSAAARSNASLGLAAGMANATNSRIEGENSLAQSQMAMGDWQQAQAQQILDLQQTDFHAETDWKRGNMEWLMGLAQGAPKTIKETSIMPSREKGMGSQLFGLAAQAAGTYFGGPAGGAAAGAAAGAIAG